MAEIVALGKDVKLEWLNATVESLLAGHTKEETADILNELIASSIRSPDNIRKARTICLNIWCGADEESNQLALDICKSCSKTDWLPVHWALIIMRYPIFADLSNVIGKLFQFRDTITTSRVKEKIYEKWSARTTVEYSLTKCIKTMKNLGVISTVDSVTVFSRNIAEVKDERTVALLIKALLLATDQKYLTWQAFIQNPLMFPFTFDTLTQADIAAVPFLGLDRMGGDVVVSLRE